jgi:hypothetical protein
MAAAGKKQINITRTTLNPYQMQLLQEIVSSEKESDHIRYAARELLKGEKSAFFIQTFNQMIECVFIGSKRDESYLQKPQSPGEWGLNYDFTVKHMVNLMLQNGKASPFYATQVAQLITGVNSRGDESSVKSSVNALFSIYMTLRRELACATTLETMTPPYKFNLEQLHALHRVIISLIIMIDTKVHPGSLANAMDLATYQKFGSVNRVNTIKQSDDPIYNRFLQYAEYLNRIL